MVQDQIPGLANIEKTRVVMLSAIPGDHHAVSDGLGKERSLVESVFTPLDMIQLLLSREFDVAIVDLALAAYHPRLLDCARNVQPWLPWIEIGPPPGAAGDATAARQESSELCLEKPWQPDALRAAVAEAIRRKRRILETPVRMPLNRMLFFLEKLQTSFQVLLASEETPHLLNYLQTAIGRMIACDVAGAFDMTANPLKLNLTIMRPVPRSFLRQVEDAMSAVCEALTGKPVPRGSVIVENEGPVSATSPDNITESLFVIPFVSGQQLHGILAFASSAPQAFSSAETSFLCHYSNHLARIFPNLRQIQRRAVRDELTGLYNRHYFEDELKRAWQMSRRYRYPIGVLLMDVDGFKAINDSYGHLVGDTVLREFSQLLESIARRTDVLARHGGDEFAVILTNANAGQTRAFAERLLDAVTSHVFCRDRYPLQVGVSVGVVTSTDLGIAGENDFLPLADRALYLSKENGKGKISTAEQANRLAEVKSAGDAPVTVPSPTPGRQGQIMIIDDEVSIGRLFEQMLTPKGFTVLTETNPRKALERIKAMPNQIDVALIDLKMPEMNGIEVIESMRALAPEIVPIVLTGFASVDNTIAAIRAGAYDFIQKPVDFEELTFTIQRGVEHRRLRQQVEGYRHQLEDTLDERTRSLRETTDALEKSYMATMEALAATLKVHENDTIEHDRRVADFAVFLARQMRLDENHLVEMKRGALLHDIGKIGIPDAILQKTGPLTDAEREIMKQHTTIGYQIVKNIPFLQDEAEMIYQHHERYDGAGYPRGLAGTAIGFEARLFAVADTFDALRSDRVYRKAVSLEEAVAEIKKGSGTQFDPAIVDVFLSCYHEMDNLYSRSTGQGTVEIKL